MFCGSSCVQTTSSSDGYDEISARAASVGNG